MHRYIFMIKKKKQVLSKKPKIESCWRPNAPRRVIAIPSTRFRHDPSLLFMEWRRDILGRY